MTEAEWLETTDPVLLLSGLPEPVSGRKQRLLGVACCRRAWHLIESRPTIRECLEFAERYADGEGAKKRLKKLVDANQHEFSRYGGRPGEDVAVALAARAAAATCDVRSSMTVELRTLGFALGGTPEADSPGQASLLRDIFGNPFRPVVVDHSWLTSDVAALARGIYDVWAFDRMPILADALQDAGCDNDDVLSHCRGPGPHVRGCWVVDLLLGKE